MNSTVALYNYKVPVIIKKKNFTFCPGKSRENSINIFQDFPGLTNKIQGLSRTAKKIQDFPGLFQDVATLIKAVPTWHKKQIKLQNSHMQKEKNQTVLERKQQMVHLITRCPVFILLEVRLEMFFGS